MDVEIRPIVVPHHYGVREAAEFEAMARFAVTIEVENWGDDRFAYTPEEFLATYLDRAYTLRRVFGAWVGSQLVGRAVAFWEHDAAARTVNFIVEVAPEWRRRGIGTRLLDQLTDAATELGRTVTTMYNDVPSARLAAPGARVSAPDGDASIPAALPAVSFARHHGYALGQIERISELRPADRAVDFRRALDDAATAAEAAGYRIVTWVDRAPDSIVDSYAAARARMALDVPAGDLVIDAEHWDAARVRAYEERAIESRRSTLMCAALTGDGTVVAYTELELPHGRRVAYQSDTLVVAAHRGHRLGMLVKLGNLVQLDERDRARTSIVTWNADENEHMLAINIALGFEVIGLSAEWQRG